LLATSGQRLVRIGLVADIPDEHVARRVVDVVQGHCEFDGAEVGRQMPAARRHTAQQQLAQCARDLRQFQLGAGAQLLG
jgi:hypothetical protein